MSRNNSGLTAAEKFCLDAYSLNRNTDLAYILSRPTPPSTTKPDILHRMALRWLRSDNVRDYLQKRAAVNKVAESNSEADIRSNADIIKDLNALLDRVDDPKLKSVLLGQLAQIQGMTRHAREENRPDNHINYYLPPRCTEECLLYISFGKFLKENNIKPTEETEWQMLDAYSRWLYRQNLEKAENEGREMV